MKRSADEMDSKKRTSIIESLLMSNCQAQRQRFAQRAASISHPAVWRNAGSNLPTFSPIAASAYRGGDGQLAYLKRLNGEEKIVGENKGEYAPAILLPRLCIQNEPEEIPNSAAYYTLVCQFFTDTPSSSADDMSLHNVTRFVFYLLDRLFSAEQNKPPINETLLTRVAMDLYQLNAQFLAAARAVKFDAVAHEYYVNGQKMALSVTKSLDQLFGQFNENEVATRMVKSRNWKRNSLFTAINFDSECRQRSEEEMCHLIQQEWKKRRDRGTMLHEFINRSLTRSMALLSVLEDGSGQRSGMTAADKTTSKRRKKPAGTDYEAKNSDGAASTSALSSVHCQALSLWKKWRNNQLKKAVAEENVPGVSGENYLCSPTDDASLASVNLLDNANVSAFARWNRLRLHDNWLLLASEYAVYDELSGIAGTIDAIFVPYPHRPDMVVLVDWKRCELDFGTRYYGPNMGYTHEYTRRYPKCNYWKYAFQLNIYREILERSHGGRLIVLDMMIVNFLADSPFPRTLSVPRIPETRLFLDDLRKRNANIVPLDAILTDKAAAVA